MRNLIFDGGELQELFVAGKDDELVKRLNEPAVKVRQRGDVSIAGLANDAGAPLATKFLMTLKGTIAALQAGGALEQAQAVLFDSFRERFVNSTLGLDFTNDELRGYITQICTAAGWSAPEVAAILATGYVLAGSAKHATGADATTEDIAAVRAAVEAEQLRQEFDASFNAWVAAAMQAGDRAAVVKGLRNMADELGA